MLKHLIHRDERRHWARDNNRVSRPFEWGLEFLPPELTTMNGGAPRDVLFAFNRRAIAESDRFFAETAPPDYQFDGHHLSFPTPVPTPYEENNTVYARYFPVAARDAGTAGEAERARRRAVIVLPHWNAKPEEHVAVCRLLNRLGIAALRLTMPYHERRMVRGCERADFMVSANLGRTIQATRQAVIETRAAATWLQSRGYDRIGIIGTSIGSCVAFLAFIHDERFKVGVHNHVSSYFGDVVWEGITTMHVRRSLEPHLRREEVREAWLAISPAAYLKRAAACDRRRLFISARYDLSFPWELSRILFEECDRHGARHDRRLLPCGHYSLGKAPFKYYVGYLIATYFQRHL